MTSNLAVQPSFPIEFKGVVIGSAVYHSLGVQFVAADRRVKQMDRSIWPSLQYAEAAARQVAAGAPCKEPG